MRAFLRKAAVAAVLLASAGAARGQALSLRHVESVYEDGKKVALKAPEGVACTERGHVVVADTGNGRLVQYALKDGAVGTGTALQISELPRPARVEIDGQGNLLVLDRKARKIGRVGEGGQFAGFVEPKAGPPLQPVGFKVDAAGRVVVLDGAGPSVVVLEKDGAVSRRLPLPKEKTLFTDVAVGPTGTLYALDARQATIWQAEPGASAFTALTKSLRDAMSFPTYLTTTARGGLVVVDQHGAGIVFVGQNGAYQGRQLALGWSEGLLYYPSQLCVTATGAVLVADRSNHRVQHFAVVK